MGLSIHVFNDENRSPLNGIYTDSILAAMLRFEQRRGTPAAYYSDRGTNFVGAQSELRGCLDRLDEKRIHERLSLRQVKWVFNPPGAPHFGGAWESLVKPAKRPFGKWYEFWQIKWLPTKSALRRWLLWKI